MFTTLSENKGYEAPYRVGGTRRRTGGKVNETVYCFQRNATGALLSVNLHNELSRR